MERILPTLFSSQSSKGVRLEQALQEPPGGSHCSDLPSVPRPALMAWCLL